MGMPNRRAYRNKVKWWYDMRRYLARKNRIIVPPGPTSGQPIGLLLILTKAQ